MGCSPWTVGKLSRLSSPVSDFYALPFHSLVTNIVYLPETIADRPSALREQAYLEERPLTLPMLDPNGWKLLAPVEAEGTLVPNAIVTAQLSIASPV